jgi:hypothetical protein
LTACAPAVKFAEFLLRCRDCDARHAVSLDGRAQLLLIRR